MNANTKDGRKKIPRTALEFLRRDPGVFRRIARRIRRSRSHISKVVAGQRTSNFVREAVICQARRLARLYGAAAVLLELEGARR